MLLPTLARCSSGAAGGGAGRRGAALLLLGQQGQQRLAAAFVLQPQTQQRSALHHLAWGARATAPAARRGAKTNTGGGVRMLKAQISGPAKGLNPAKAQEVLKKAQAVAFDVDSTVCAEEGIDVLADFLGQGEAVAELTAKAMGGSVLFQDALKARLDLIKPSRQNFTDCLRERPATLSDGVAEFIRLLQARGTDVYLVSGGFRLMIEPVAERLRIPKDRIYANTVLFHPDGSYRDFDPKEPTSRDGGKPAVIKSLKERFGYGHVVMVGDGATDMQARPPADAFVGYGGVVVREAVAKGADWYVHSFEDLIRVVK